MNDEEVAFRIVRLYFEEIARLGFKRSLDLDQMINSYFYALKRLQSKEAMRQATEKVIKEEKIITSKEIPSTVSTTTVKKETIPVVKEVTTTTTTVEKPKEKMISEIIESK